MFLLPRCQEGGGHDDDRLPLAFPPSGETSGRALRQLYPLCPSSGSWLGWCGFSFGPDSRISLLMLVGPGPVVKPIARDEFLGALIMLDQSAQDLCTSHIPKAVVGTETNKKVP